MHTQTYALYSSELGRHERKIVHHFARLSTAKEISGKEMWIKWMRVPRVLQLKIICESFSHRCHRVCVCARIEGTSSQFVKRQSMWIVVVEMLPLLYPAERKCRKATATIQNALYNFFFVLLDSYTWRLTDFEASSTLMPRPLPFFWANFLFHGHHSWKLLCCTRQFMRHTLLMCCAKLFSQGTFTVARCIASNWFMALIFISVSFALPLMGSDKRLHWLEQLAQAWAATTAHWNERAKHTKHPVLTFKWYSNNGNYCRKGLTTIKFSLAE